MTRIAHPAGGSGWRARAGRIAAEGGLHLHDVWELDSELPGGYDLDDLEARLREARLPPVVAALFELRALFGKATRVDRGDTGFRLVYSEPHERLYRIENTLVTAMAHFVIVERRLQLAVYVKAHNRRGALYLHAIEPARRFVVYPRLLRWAGRQLPAAAPG